MAMGASAFEGCNLIRSEVVDRTLSLLDDLADRLDVVKIIISVKIRLFQ